MQIFDPWQPVVVPVFPFDVLSPCVRQFVEAQARVIGCDPSALAMVCLAAISGAIDHRVTLRMMRNGNWRASPRLWLMLVGPPSFKKSPAIRAAIKPLVSIDHERRNEYERLLELALAVDPKAAGPKKPPRLIAHDVTTEKLGEILARQDRGITIIRDEIAGWIGSMERYGGGKGVSSDRAFWLESYDGGSFTVDRISRGELQVKDLSVSIIGGIQPARLKELDSLTSDGLLQRFLPVMMRESEFPIDEPTDTAERAYTGLMRSLVHFPPVGLVMTDEALQEAESARKRLHDLESVADGVVAGFDGFAGKLAGVLGSLAIVLHLSTGAAPMAPIEAVTVQNAARIIEDFIIPHALEFYRTSAATDGDRLRSLASYLLTSEKCRVTASDLCSNVAAFKGVDLQTVNKRVSPLIAGGWIEAEDTSLMAKAWRVNPNIYVLFAERSAREEERKAAIARAMNGPRRAKAG